MMGGTPEGIKDAPPPLGASVPKPPEVLEQAVHCLLFIIYAYVSIINYKEYLYGRD